MGALHKRKIALWLAASRGYLWYFSPSPRVFSPSQLRLHPDRGNSPRAAPFWRTRASHKTQFRFHSTREPLKTLDLRRAIETRQAPPSAVPRLLLDPHKPPSPPGSRFPPP